MAVRRNYATEIHIIPTAHLDLQPNLLELWTQVAVRGELNPEGEFVKWNETTWEQKRQQLATVPAPHPEIPFPGYLATDKLHWLRAELDEADTDANRLHLAQDLLRRADEAGDRNEAVRWRGEVARLEKLLAPPAVKP